MQRHNIYIFLVVGCCCAALCSAPLLAATDLAARQAAAAALEAECQQMVAAEATLQELAPMYKKVAHAYLRCGKQSACKVAEYCEKALACPQSVLDEITLLTWSGFAATDAPAADAAAAATNRRQAVTHYLQALNVVVAHQTATRPQPIPRTGPQREQVLLQNNLVASRECLIQCIAEAYRLEGTRSELAELTDTVLTSATVASDVLIYYDTAAVRWQ